MLELFFVVLLSSRKHLAFLFLYRFKCIGPSKRYQLVIYKVSACHCRGGSACHCEGLFRSNQYTTRYFVT
uniref:Uncharacterized protein n=1 Tax=Kuenenia stuttgartiensis TaxID=174633 RepID=Q1PUS0_KUEST|nr:unknown protein [Candidatus Kuenenia stuttgartiensis]